MKSFTPRHVLALAAIIAAGVVLQPVAAVATSRLVELVDSSTNTPAKIDATGALLTTTNATVRTTPADAPVRIAELQLRGGGPAATVSTAAYRKVQVVAWTSCVATDRGCNAVRLTGGVDYAAPGGCPPGTCTYANSFVAVAMNFAQTAAASSTPVQSYVFDNLLPSLVFKPQNTTATTGAASVGVRVIVYGIK